MGWTDIESAKRQHAAVQKSHFISCWTTEPESVAMWSLYSPDHTCVQMKTSIGKLRQALLNLLNEKSFAHLSDADIGKRVVVCTGARISNVDYVPLQDLLYKVTRRAKAHDRIADQYKRQGRDLPTIGSIPSRFYEREAKRRFQVLESSGTCNLKDASFKHEHEVRVIAKFGEEGYTKGMLEEKEILNPAHESHWILKHDLAVWGSVRTVDVPAYEFAKCSADFVESIAIDPRCPKYKREFMEHWFSDRDIPIGKSHCFGYMPDTFTVFPEA